MGGRSAVDSTNRVVEEGWVERADERKEFPREEGTSITGYNSFAVWKAMSRRLWVWMGQ